MTSKLRKTICFVLALVTVMCFFMSADKANAATAYSRGGVPNPVDNILIIKVSGSSTSKTYSGDKQYYTGTVTATCNDPRFSPSKFSYSGKRLVSGLTVGTYSTAIDEKKCSYNDSRYDVIWEIDKSKPIKMTINPKTLNVTVKGSSTEETYTGAMQSYTGTVTATCSDSFFKAAQFSYSGTKTVSGKNANSYTAPLVKSKCSYTDPNCVCNWIISDPIKMTIVPRKITITVCGTSAEIVNGTNPEAYSGITVTQDGKYKYNGYVYPACSDSGFDESRFSYSGQKTVTASTVGTHTTAIDLSKCFYDDVNVAVTWKKNNNKPLQLTIQKNNNWVFQDVDPEKYYSSAIDWAKSVGIAYGTDAAGLYFKPETNISRAQVIEFIWRTMGRPAPLSETNPYADVETADITNSSYRAALWAYYNTPQVLLDTTVNGNGKVTYGGSNKCTRVQAMTLAWKAMGEPEPLSYQNNLSDISSLTEEARTAVLWAYNHDVDGFGFKLISATDMKIYPNTKMKRGDFIISLYNLTQHGVYMPLAPEQPHSIETGDSNETTWPIFAAGKYCEIIAPNDITVYQSTTCNGQAIGTLLKNCRCRAYEITSRYIRISYDNAMGEEVSGYIKRETLIEMNTVYKYQVNFGGVQTYRRIVGGFGISYPALAAIKENTTVYCMPNPDANADSYVQVIFVPDYNPGECKGLEYRLGWVTRDDYESIKHPDYCLPGDGIYLNDFLSFACSQPEGSYVPEWLDHSVENNYGLFNIVSYQGNYYYSLDRPTIGGEVCPYPINISPSVFRQEISLCYPNLSIMNHHSGNDTTNGNQYQYYFYTRLHESSKKMLDEQNRLYQTDEYWTYVVVVENAYHKDFSNLELTCTLKHSYKIVTKHKYLINAGTYADDCFSIERMDAKPKSFYPNFDVKVQTIGYYNDPNKPDDIGKPCSFDKMVSEGANLNALDKHLYVLSYQFCTSDESYKDTEYDPANRVVKFAYGVYNSGVFKIIKDITHLNYETALKAVLEAGEQVWDQLFKKAKTLAQNGHEQEFSFECKELSQVDTSNGTSGSDHTYVLYELEGESPVPLKKLGKYVKVTCTFNTSYDDLIDRVTIGMSDARVSFDWE